MTLSHNAQKTQRIAELETQLKTALGVIDKIDDTYEEKIAALLVAIEAKDRVIRQWINTASYCSIESGCCGCGEDMARHSSPMYCGHSPVDMAHSAVESLIASSEKAISPSTELLEARDRKRDAKMLRVIAEKHFAPGRGHYEQLELLAEHRESGEWKPEL